MSQPAEVVPVTAEQARAEYLAACNEVTELDVVIGFLDEKIRAALTATDSAVTADREELEVRRASNRFWMLLEMRAFAARALADVLAARRYSYDVWQSAQAHSGSRTDDGVAVATSGQVGVDANVSTPIDTRLNRSTRINRPRRLRWRERPNHGAVPHSTTQ